MAKRNKSTLYIEYLLAYLGKNLILLLPWYWARKVGRLLGWLTQYLLPKRRKIVFDNLQHSFPEKNEKEIKHIAEQIWKNIGITTGEFIKILHLNENNLSTYVEITGEDRLKRNLEIGKGVILLSAHFCNWEIIHIALAIKGYPIAGIARPLENYMVNRLVNSVRESKGGRIILASQGMKEALSWLRMNRLVYVLIDQRITEGDVYVNFFNRPAATTPAVAILAKRTGAPVLPVYTLRGIKGKLSICIERPVTLKRMNNIHEETLQNTAYFTKIIEEWIKAYPSEWFWLHNRWKR